MILWSKIRTSQKRKEAFTMKEITKDMKIGELLDADRTLAPYFIEMGMHCLGCALATAESLEQACAAHGVDPDEFIVELKAYLLAL